MADLVVSIDDREIRRAAKAYARLGESVPRAIRDSLSEIAVDAQERLRDRWQRDIEGGPARFSEIQPGGRKGAVLDRRARQDGDGITSSIAVNRLQSTYLKYSLGEERVRTPGDAGAASDYNFIWTGTRAAMRGVGVTVDKHGNLPRNSLRKLIRASTSQRDRDRANVKKRAAEAGREATDEDFSAFRQSRKARSKGEIRRVDQRVGAGSGSQIFFGRLRRGGSGPVGFWQRPFDSEGKGRPSLLVLGVERSTYRSDKLLDGWNESVMQAAEDLSRKLQKRLQASLNGRGDSQE
ncbi:hypothetical protein NS365_05480 [Aureimonas ureilytica]|uniref:Uncharacterized protein n=1 Tax=Aureimonas ureilytica TaxID=401562 RepID=A0A175RT51_9HYPH|nr:hypothetical protein [Aureimonas ureilytica]KTR06886.1 hypothetical protein NS365_05480 [Aureimonas ureilytica]